MPPSNKRFRLTSIARCRAKRPLDDLESYVRSVRHAEERLRQDLREAERDLAEEKDYSSKVKRERDDLRKEIKEVLDAKARQQEKIRDLKNESDILQKIKRSEQSLCAARRGDRKTRHGGFTARRRRAVENSDARTRHNL